MNASAFFNIPVCRLVGALILSLLINLPAIAQQSGNVENVSTSNEESIENYWTPERMKEAKPMFRGIPVSPESVQREQLDNDTKKLKAKHGGLSESHPEEPGAVQGTPPTGAPMSGGTP